MVEEEEKVANAIAKSVFTTVQFHELQLQAVIFKYIVSGLPVPFHLFFTIWNTVSSSLGSAVINKLYPTCNVPLLWLFFCPFNFVIVNYIKNNCMVICTSSLKDNFFSILYSTN